MLTTTAPLDCGTLIGLLLLAAALPRAHTQCGTPQIMPKHRAKRALGETALENSWPWQVVIGLVRAGSRQRWWAPGCGGSLVDPYTIVTAAHCFYDHNPGRPRYRPTDFCVFVGVHDIADAQRRNVPCRRVRAGNIHPDYDHNLNVDDMAVLFLAEPVQLSHAIHPVCLSAAEATPGTTCYATGFGRTRVLSMSFTLVQARVTVKSQATCQAIWGRAYDTRKQICALGARGQDACQGDSGGPLVCKHGNVWQLQGVVSYGGNRCGDFSKPGVYTRVRNYVPWINARMQADHASVFAATQQLIPASLAAGSQAQAPPLPPIRGSPGLAPPQRGHSNCADTHDRFFCCYWASSGECTGANRFWMWTNCARACGTCGCSGNCQVNTANNRCPPAANFQLAIDAFEPQPAATADRCVDSRSECGFWALRGECQSNLVWMRNNCRRSCGLCAFALAPQLPNPAAVCTDAHHMCTFWAAIGECNRNGPYMQANCRLSCARC